MSNHWEHELQQCLDTDIDFPVAEFIKLHSEVPPPTIRRRHAQLRATLMKRLQKRAALGIQASTVASLNTPESQAAKGSCGGKRNKDVFCKGMHMLNLLHLDLSSGSITNSGACALANELCNAQTLTHMLLDLGYNHIGPLGVASLFRLMGQYKKLQSFYLNVCANQRWDTQNELAKPFYIQQLATTLCSIQLDFQDIGLVDHSVIDLVNTLVNK